MPTLQLYGQSIELALKAFLLKRGTSLADVKNLRHKLTDILAIARKRKLGTQLKFSRQDIGLIDLLHINYAVHRFRYAESGATTVPALPAIASLAQRVVFGLEQYCTGTAGRLLRGRG